MTVAGFIAAGRTEHGVPSTVACRALGVSQSWFYKWRNRTPTRRQQRRRRLAEAIRQVFDESGATYGSPRVTAELHAAGWRVSVNTVARLMAELGLAGRRPRRRRSLTRQATQTASAPDLVRRDFTAAEPNVAWCGDLTEIPTDEGPLHLAGVEDMFSRRVLGFAMGPRHDAQLATAAVTMATATRGGAVRGVVFHSDRGSEYTSRLFRNACARLGITQSMGRAGSALDNAAAESFFATLKTEAIHRCHFATHAEARRIVAGWIDDFYNRRRRHSHNGMLSPIDYELAALKAAQPA